ncbi:hypothetical protein EVAR_56864_1 [Eumeta japonica]|uniref:Uncharacterized protein n=1 Tax=Eumeta variegata TaxID=151549 RepID=A0A4C1YUH2_EUMVA|nr:hypothetical protein EVAR_56864_1 [Eumeta japonica]
MHHIPITNTDENLFTFTLSPTAQNRFMKDVPKSEKDIQTGPDPLARCACDLNRLRRVAARLTRPRIQRPGDFGFRMQIEFRTRKWRRRRRGRMRRHSTPVVNDTISVVNVFCLFVIRVRLKDN